ncbi:MAG TPA: DUF5818 domain-containing protein [Terriglobales bacterium]|nr:DUF5818 domain-containing protein [Terriglobales bacterium]
MTKTLLLAIALMFSTIWLQAQDQTSPSQASQAAPQDQYPQGQPQPQSPQTGPQDQTAPTASGQAGTRASGEISVEGCLQNSNGSYMLMAASGATYQLQGDSAILSKHVGHEVRVTGTPSSSAATAGSAGSSMGGGSQAAPMLSVDKLKHISKTCNSSGMGK